MADGVWITGFWSAEGLTGVRVYATEQDAVQADAARKPQIHVWFVPWGEDTGNSKWWRDSWPAEDWN